MHFWSSILRELLFPHKLRFLDIFYRMTVHVCRKMRISHHGETFFQRKLEPISASNTVS